MSELTTELYANELAERASHGGTMVPLSPLESEWLLNYERHISSLSDEERDAFMSLPVHRLPGKRIVIAYKLVTRRADGSLGPLFINRRQRFQVGVWMEAEDHPTRGYAHRPGWHCTTAPSAPHLSTKGRSWVRVAVCDFIRFQRPASQGGEWILANHMAILPDDTQS